MTLRRQIKLISPLLSMMDQHIILKTGQAMKKDIYSIPPLQILLLGYSSIM